MNHTPGPWEQQNHYVVSDRYERLQVIARCGGHQNDPLNWACHEIDTENIANARLLAAAPDLLSALKYWFDSKADPKLLADKALAAIAKAEGE